MFDEKLNMNKQILNTCRSAWLQLRQIGKIRSYLDRPSAERLIHTFVISRLDQNNGLLYGAPDFLLKKLVRVQYGAARILTRCQPRIHMMPILCNLHWLPVPFRISFKLLLLTYKALNGLAPTYIQELVVLKKSSRTLRSNNTLQLQCIKAKTFASYGDRAFVIAAPKLWNPLPLSLKSAQSIDHFKSQLKQHLFRIAFKDYI